MRGRASRGSGLDRSRLGNDFLSSSVPSIEHKFILTAGITLAMWHSLPQACRRKAGYKSGAILPAHTTAMQVLLATEAAHDRNLKGYFFVIGVPSRLKDIQNLHWDSLP